MAWPRVYRVWVPEASGNHWMADFTHPHYDAGKKAMKTGVKLCIIVVEILCFIVFAVHALYFTPLSIAAACTL